MRHRSGPGDSRPASSSLLGFRPSPTAAEPQGVWPIAEAHTSNITGVAFSPDGRTLATSSLDGTAKLWYLARGRPRATTLKDESDAGANSVTFSPVRRPSPPVGVAAGTPGGRPGLHQDPWLWDAATAAHRRTIRTPAHGVRRITFARDGRHIGTIDADWTARTWDIADGRSLTETKLPAGFGPATFSPDLATLAAAGDDDIRLIQVATGREVARLAAAEKRPHSLAFSSDGKALTCGAGSPSHDAL